jgi:hypothetical protein
MPDEPPETSGPSENKRIEPALSWTDDAINRHAGLFAMLSGVDSPLHQSSPPERLYHYTTAPATRGIIEKRELWATHFAFLNDSSELAYGLELFAEVVKKIRSLEGHGRAILNLMDDSLIHSVLIKNSILCAFCLSEADDDLSQWRAYSSKGSTGYSLGFDSAGLTKLDAGGPLFLVKVLYDPAEQTDVIENMLALFSVHTQRLDEQTWEQDRWLISHAFAVMMQRALIRMKRKSFQGEAEWRLVYSAGVGSVTRLKDLDSRISNSGVMVPFRRITAPPDTRLPLVSVMVGPSTHSETAAFGIYQLLLKNNYPPECDVRKCEIPLREL